MNRSWVEASHRYLPGKSTGADTNTVTVHSKLPAILV
jgi:hypothetical protein